MLVAGDLKKPLLRRQITPFLENLFPSHPYQFSSYNVNEFMKAFGREGTKTKALLWSDIRKVLREHKRGDSKFMDSIFIKTALSPDAAVVKLWRQMMDFVAIYHFVVVPVRICFAPWTSMLDYRLLCTDLVADILTIFNFFVLANTAYLNSRAAWVTNRYKIFRKVDLHASISATPLDWYSDKLHTLKDQEIRVLLAFPGLHSLVEVPWHFVLGFGCQSC